MKGGGLQISGEEIVQRARALGFDACGIVPLRKSSNVRQFQEWLGKGYHATMKWMERNQERRTDPRKFFPGAQSAIVCIANYFQYSLPREVLHDPSRGIIARYAWLPDYHAVVERALQKLTEEIRDMGGKAVLSGMFRPVVDTAPVFERELAQQARAGFIGKNTMLISPSLGSFLFIGEIITDALLPFVAAREPSSLGEEGCFRCTRCVRSCPTGALKSSRVLDAGKCIAYLTIELKESIPHPLRPLMGNRIFGCDICQEVCPWNKQYARRTSFLFKPRPEWSAPRLIDILSLSEEEFKSLFQGSPILRAKWRGLVRNAAVAAGNWGSEKALPALRRAASRDDPIIREHAQWAIRRICSQKK